MHRLRIIERACWVVGIGLLTVYVSVRTHGELSRRADLARFDEAASAVAAATPAPDALDARDVPAGADDAAAEMANLEIPAVDVSLWSADRVRHYEETLSTDPGLRTSPMTKIFC